MNSHLLDKSLDFATEIELLCQSIKALSNTLFQIRKSSSSVYANIREANYGQSKADMLSKFEIALSRRFLLTKAQGRQLKLPKAISLCVSRI